MLESELMMSLPSTAKIERGLRSKLNLLHDSDFGIINKKEIKKMVENKKNRVNDYGSSKPSVVEAPEINAGTFEYKMPQGMADVIVKSSKYKSNPQQALCDYVNTECGLKGYCTKVIVGL